MPSSRPRPPGVTLPAASVTRPPPAFEPALVIKPQRGLPLLWFALFRAPTESAPDRPGPVQVSEWQSATDRQTYERNVAAVRASIARGDTYQVNYTIRLRAQFTGDAFAFYQQLAGRQQAAYCAYLHTGRYTLLSAAPELFFHWDGRHLITRPMKGTAARGRWLEEDEARADWLAQSEKNRAENTMVVDLMRNDLGRIAATGTVRVRQLCRVARYPTVWQMTLTVIAQTRQHVTLSDIFNAHDSGSSTASVAWWRFIMQSMNFKFEISNLKYEIKSALSAPAAVKVSWLKLKRHLL